MTDSQIQKVKDQLIERLLKGYGKVNIFPEKFRIGKDLLNECSENDDLKSIMDEYFSNSLLNDYGFEYLPDDSSDDELVFRYIK